MLPGGLLELDDSPTRARTTGWNGSPDAHELFTQQLLPVSAHGAIEARASPPNTQQQRPPPPTTTTTRLGPLSTLWKGLRIEATGFWRAAVESNENKNLDHWQLARPTTPLDAVGMQPLRSSSKRQRRDSSSSEVMCATVAGHQRRHSATATTSQHRSEHNKRQKLQGPLQSERAIAQSDKAHRQQGRNASPTKPILHKPTRPNAPSHGITRPSGHSESSKENHVHFDLPLSTASPMQPDAALVQTTQVATALLGSSNGFQAVAQSWRTARHSETQRREPSQRPATRNIAVGPTSPQRRIQELEAEVERLRHELSQARSLRPVPSPAEKAAPPPSPPPPPPPPPRNPGPGAWRQRLRPTTPERGDATRPGGHKRRQSSIGGASSSLDMGAFLNEMRTKKLRKVGTTTSSTTQGIPRPSSLRHEHVPVSEAGSRPGPGPRHGASRSSGIASTSWTTAISNPTPSAVSSSLLVGPTVSPSMPTQTPRPAPVPPAPTTPSPRAAGRRSAPRPSDHSRHDGSGGGGGGGEATDDMDSASRRLSAARKRQAPIPVALDRAHCRRTATGAQPSGDVVVINYSRPITPARRRAMLERAEAQANAGTDANANANAQSSREQSEHDSGKSTVVGNSRDESCASSAAAAATATVASTTAGTASPQRLEKEQHPRPPTGRLPRAARRVVVVAAPDAGAAEPAQEVPEVPRPTHDSGELVRLNRPERTSSRSATRPRGQTRPGASRQNDGTGLGLWPGPGPVEGRRMALCCNYGLAGDEDGADEVRRGGGGPGVSDARRGPGAMGSTLERGDEGQEGDEKAAEGEGGQRSKHRRGGDWNGWELRRAEEGGA